MLSVAFLSVLLVLVVPTALWFGTRDEASELWPPRVVGTEDVGRGEFREAHVPTLRAEIPGVVRAAAIGSWVLGCMFVPGLLLGLVGLVVMGLGLVSVPGLVLAARLFLLGKPLLRGEPEAAPKARSAARFAVILNAFVLALCGVGLAVTLSDVARHGFRAEGGMVLMVLAVVAYAGLSLGHAALLRRAADAIEARWRTPTTTGLRIEDALDAALARPAPPEEEVAVVGEDARRALPR